MSAVTPFNPINIGVFQPNQIDGLALWLDAADSSTVLTSGANVTSWNDKSGNGCNATQLTAGNRPTYSNNGVRFTASSSNFLNINVPFNTSHSVFLVGSSVSGTQNYYYGRVGGGAAPSIIQYYIGRSIEYFDGSDRGVFSASPPTTSPFMVNFVRSFGNNVSGFYFGSNAFSISQTWTFDTVNPWAYIGRSDNNSNYLNATISEFLIFRTALSTNDRQAVESYLAYKWNLQQFLPTTHPYYASPYNAIANFTNINQITKFAYPILPNQFAGLALWLDAADSATVLRTGSNVTRWNDKSGNGFNMSNNALYQSPTYSATGFNGQPTISFSRTNSNSFSILENTAFSFSQNSFTLFFIAQRNGSDTSYQRFFSVASSINGTDNNSVTSFNISSHFQNGSLGLERAAFTRVAGFTTTNLFLGEIIVNGTASAVGNFNTVTNYIYANGSQIGVGTTPTAGTNFSIVHVRLGSATMSSAGNDNGVESFQGNMSEVLLFNRVLTTSEFTQIEGYLAWKWGLQSKLPVTHPYYNNAFIPNLPRSIPTTIVPYIYSPRLLSGLSLWLDAADTSRMTLVGSNISQYTDKSSNAFILSNATSANQPTLVFDSNNLPNMLFNGTSQYLVNSAVAASNLTLSNEVTIFFIHTPSNATNCLIAWANNSISGGIPRINFVTPEGSTGFKFDYSSYISGRVETVVANYLTSGRRLEGGYKRGTTQVIRAYGLDLAQITNNLTITGSTSLPLALGWFFNLGGYYYGGRFCELVWYNRGLNDNEIQQIEGYLAWKWGLQANLPASHPYKLYPPG